MATVNPVRDVYSLVFQGLEGEELQRLQFDTLDIALDQAKSLVGVTRAHWMQS
jgi:hypothetical protein